nr:MAG TPA: hypothetical protein [Caudoviricetes sp.]
MFQLFSAALAVIRPRLTNSRINSRIKPAITFHLPPLSGAFFHALFSGVAGWSIPKSSFGVTPSALQIGTTSSDVSRFLPRSSALNFFGSYPAALATADCFKHFSSMIL